MKVNCISNNYPNMHTFSAKYKLVTDYDILPKDILQKYEDLAKSVGNDNDTILIGFNKCHKLSDKLSSTYNLFGKIIRPFTCILNGDYKKSYKTKDTLTETFQSVLLTDHDKNVMKEIIESELLNGLKNIPDAIKRIEKRDNIEFCKWLNK